MAVILFSRPMYIFTVFEKSVVEVLLDQKSVKLTQFDTAGQGDYERLRPRAYKECHMVFD